MGFRIIGTGSARPETVLTNDDLTAFLDTNDEWIRTRTGITERRVLQRGESLLDLAVQAAKAALADANLSGAELDGVICSTLQGECISPSMACMIAGAVGATCGRVMDVNMGCCGFLYATDIANAYFSSQQAKRILVVSAEAMSRMVDWTDRATCVLFGDAAGAAVLEAGDALVASHFTSLPNREVLEIHANSGNFGGGESGQHFLYMQGQEVYKFAVTSIVRDITTILQESGLSADDIGHFVLHQANRRIIEAARVKLGQSEEKFPCNLNHYGNTSSATIPMLLDELNKSGALRQGELLVLSAFGAGLASGVCVVKWDK